MSRNAVVRLGHQDDPKEIDMDHVGARGLFCSMYMNAVYKGIFNLTERFREPFFQQHYNSTASWDVDYSWQWVDGDGNAMWQLVTLLGGDITGAAACSTGSAAIPSPPCSTLLYAHFAFSWYSSRLPPYRSFS